MEVEIALESGHVTTAIVYHAASPPGSTATLILAHGAGAGQRHPFMVAFARALSERGIDLVTFDFLYMHEGRRVPDRMPQLMSCYRSVIAAVPNFVDSAREHLFVGGKSMGGRVATYVLAEAIGSRSPVKGIVLLGYPLHPPGRLDQLRDAHLPEVKVPMLFVQGSRDTFGTAAELAAVVTKISDALSPPATLYPVEGGDHSFKISGAGAAKRQAEVFRAIQDTIATWVRDTA
jgi:predicted alpha/beta-hydrolase family hydrolase